MDDKVGVALVIVEDDINLGVHPVVHAGVIEVTGGVAGVDGRRAPHGGISYRKPANTEERYRFSSGHTEGKRKYTWTILSVCLINLNAAPLSVLQHLK